MRTLYISDINSSTSCGFNLWHTFSMPMMYSRWHGYLGATAKLGPQASQVSWVWVRVERFMSHFLEELGRFSLSGHLVFVDFGGHFGFLCLNGHHANLCVIPFLVK